MGLATIYHKRCNACRHYRYHALLAGILMWCVPVSAQQVHPHLLAGPQDRKTILNKIHDQPWAAAAYQAIVKEVTPYVRRHEKDPTWILSRYLMNRVPGKRYTVFYSDASGTKLTGYGGDAPRPTVRVSPNKRGPITPDGHSYRMPSIEELIPFDTSMQMRLQRNAPDSGWVLTDPKSYVGSINGRINRLALDAAIVYWLTGKAPYGIFAADILDQWAHGAYYQQPIVGPCRTGFLHMQTLGDDQTVPLILTYDFLYDFLRQKKYDTTPYETVLDKIAATMTFRGFVNNNWFAAQTPAMVTAALSLEDTTKRNNYLRFYLQKDTIHDGCGHLAIPSMIARWLTPDGHWKETAGYHNYATGNFLVSALIMEKNGYPVFEKYPALFQASYVLLKYAFPNLLNPAFGDNAGRPSESPRSLEIALVMAQHQKDVSLRDRLATSMNALLSSGRYRRSTSGYLGLLCFLPNIPKPATLPDPWPRSGHLDYAGLYLQRNGTDSLHGLMYVVQGATYNHNHAGGMAMELYGAGKVMGADPGDGLNYDAPMHIRYYAEWAAHNTVVTAERSAPIPRFKGGGGSKHMGKISLVAMEPRAEAPAVSPYCSFTDTRYTDMTTGSPEERTLAIIRLSDSAGYYVDIYRSGDSLANDYLYHNIGDTLVLLGNHRQPLAIPLSPFPVDTLDADPPGFSALRGYRSTGKQAGSVIALFKVPAPSGPTDFMQVYLPGEQLRAYYTALAPATQTAGFRYRQKPTPTLIIHQQGEAWSRPFLAVYEPYRGANGFVVNGVERLKNELPGSFTALRVTTKGTTGQQLIFQSPDTTQTFHAAASTFKGRFGVAAFRHDNSLSYLYLGKGRSLSWKRYGIRAQKPVSCNLQVDPEGITVTSTDTVEISIPSEKASQVLLQTQGKTRLLSFTQFNDHIMFSVPPVREGKIRVTAAPK